MTTTVASALHQALVDAGLAIDGVSLGRRFDKSTWRVDFRAPPSGADVANANAVIAAFDPKTFVPSPTVSQRLAALETAVQEVQTSRVTK